MGWVRLAALGIAVAGAPARAAEVVVVPLSALVPLAESAPARAPLVAAWDGVAAQVALAGAGAAAASLRWEGTLRVYEGGRPFSVALGAGLVLEALTLDGRPLPASVAVHSAGGGLQLRGTLPAGVHTLTLRGAVPVEGGALRFALPDGARASLRAAGAGLRFSGPRLVPVGRGGFAVPGGGAVALSWAPDGPPPPRPRAILADTGVELRVEPGAVEGRARVRGRVVNGAVEALDIDFGRPVTELRVEGVGLGDAVSMGHAVRVPFLEPREGPFEVDLRFRAAGAGAAPLPQVIGARGRLFVGVLEDTGVLAAPRPLARLEPVSAGAVPEWARGLVEGQPLVRYAGDGAGARLELGALAWSAVDAPPTVVDDAHYQAVYAGHGRVYLRGALLVRNDRGPFLAVVPPPGARLAGARVAGRTAAVAQRADGAWLVPLERSVESLDGLVQFPVDLLFVGEGPAWSRRGARRVVAPALDAPVAALRWELTLPADRQARRATGAGRVVGDFTAEGLAFGRGGRAPAPAAAEVAAPAALDKRASVEAWNAAYRAYQDNDFDAAEGLLQQSLELDADNAAARALQGNVDVLLGKKKADTPEEEGAARRVREMAKAKTGDLEVRQEALSNALEDAVRRGDEGAAADTAAALLSVTRSLSIVENDTSVEQKNLLKSLEARQPALVPAAPATVGSTSGLATDARNVDANVGVFAPPEEPAPGLRSEYLFDDVEVTGQMVLPEGVKGSASAAIGGLGLSGYGRGGGGAAEVRGRDDDLAGGATVEDIVLADGEVALLFGGDAALREDDERHAAPAPAAAAPAPPPPPPPREAIEEEVLDNISAGRASEAVVSEVHVVAAGRARAARKDEAAKESPARGPAPPPGWGLPIPVGITATTLSLSLPVDTVDLRVERQLLPPGEVPVLDLTVRPRRPR